MIPKLVYDVGMNNGDDAAYYLSLGYRVVAVEANPVLVAQGLERFAKEVAAGALTILNIGISNQEGELPFWICDGVSEWSSFDKSIASRDGVACHEIVVTCCRFASPGVRDSILFETRHRGQRDPLPAGSGPA